MSSPDLGLIQRNVLHIITKYPEAANNEALLLERYWVEIDNWNEDKSLFWNLSRVTRPETISRRRREIYNLGLISYSPEAEDDRMVAMANEQDRAQPTYSAVSWLND